MKHLQELPAWRELWQHFDATKSDHMRELFATDPGRAERYWLEVGGLKVDYSKNRITDETLALLMKLAREAGLPERMKQMFRGEKINTTENRAALHVALRNQRLTWPAGSAGVLFHLRLHARFAGTRSSCEAPVRRTGEVGDWCRIRAFQP